MAQATLGIIVGGGPAPGINGVIGAAAIEAINSGLKVVGFYAGFRYLAEGEFDPDEHTTELTIKEVARIHFDGGSVLRTSRTSLLNQSKLEEGKAIGEAPAPAVPPPCQATCSCEASSPVRR